jgi:Zn-dependent alcohol dehydrogenase
MKTRAAIIRQSPGKFEVTEIDLEEPRQGEIRVKMAATGLCHSDEHLQTGDMTAAHYPIVAGHEGAGVVEAVGPGTPGWEPGDHVVMSFIPSCGHCRWCSEGMTNLCDLGAHLLWGSRFDELDSFRFHLADGSDAGQSCGVGSFAEHTVVSVDSAVKVDRDLPLDRLCLLGCGVGTGWAGAARSTRPAPGRAT